MLPQSCWADWNFHCTHTHTHTSWVKCNGKLWKTAQKIYILSHERSFLMVICETEIIVFSAIWLNIESISDLAYVNKVLQCGKFQLKNTGEKLGNLPALSPRLSLSLSVSSANFFLTMFAVQTFVRLHILVLFLGRIKCKVNSIIKSREPRERLR